MLSPNQLYQLYLQAYQNPSSMDYGIPSMDYGIPSVAPISSLESEGQVDMQSFAPTTRTGSFNVFGAPISQYASNYINNPANILGTAASFALGPVGGFLATRGAIEAQRRGFLPETFTGGSSYDSEGIGSFAQSMAEAESVDGGFDDSENGSETGYGGPDDDSDYGGGVTGGSFGE